ncbi:hypothetical protein BGC30_00055 [Novacetimonas hansenii]|nr:hypothetical protein BGC30_00055 [Novacetimonas hansenii]
MKIGEVGASWPPFSFVLRLGWFIGCGFVDLAGVDSVRAEARRRGDGSFGVRALAQAAFGDRLRLSAT